MNARSVFLVLRFAGSVDLVNVLCFKCTAAWEGGVCKSWATLAD